MKISGTENQQLTGAIPSRIACKLLILRTGGFHSDRPLADGSLMPSGFVGQRFGIELSGTDPSVVKIYRTRKAESLFAAIAVDIQSSGHPVVPAGAIVDRGTVQVDIVCMETMSGLSQYRLLAKSHGLVDAERVVVTTIVVSLTVVRPVLILPTIAVRRRIDRSTVTLGNGAIAVLIIARVDGWNGPVGIPGDFKRISSSATVPVFDLDDRDSTVVRIANQFLPSPAVHTPELNVGWAGR